MNKKTQKTWAEKFFVVIGRLVLGLVLMVLANAAWIYHESGKFYPLSYLKYETYLFHLASPTYGEAMTAELRADRPIPFQESCLSLNDNVVTDGVPQEVYCKCLWNTSNFPDVLDAPSNSAVTDDFTPERKQRMQNCITEDMSGAQTDDTTQTQTPVEQPSSQQEPADNSSASNTDTGVTLSSDASEVGYSFDNETQLTALMVQGITNHDTLPFLEGCVASPFAGASEEARKATCICLIKTSLQPYWFKTNAQGAFTPELQEKIEKCRA